MLVVNRFRVEHDGGEDPLAGGFVGDLQAAYALLAEKPGFLDGEIARNLDEPDLWVLVTRWRDVGSYRRALSSYDVKVGAVPLLGRAVDEPSAYETLGERVLNQALPRITGEGGRPTRG